MAALLHPPLVAGYAFKTAPDLTDPSVRGKLSPSAIKAFLKIAAKWSLTESQARGLLGGIVSSTFHVWKTDGTKQKLNQDTLVRISLVIGIYKALQTYFGHPWADRWITAQNRGPMFDGTAPIDYLIRQGQPGMVQVRRMLDAWHSGH